MIRFPKGRDTYSKSIGVAATVLASSPANGRTFEFVERVLRPAVRHEQIGFLSTQHLGDTCFFAWAYLHPFSVSRILKSGIFEISESDWSEDGNPVIIDIVSVVPLHRNAVVEIYNGVKARCVQDFGFHRPLSRLSCKRIVGIGEKESRSIILKNCSI